MVHLAFTSAVLLVHSGKSCTPAWQAKRLSFTKLHRRLRATPWRASSIPEPEKGGSSADDDALNLELRKKVNELFGSRQNVSIDVETDSGVQFIVRKREVAADYRQTKAAWTVITSIAVISLIAGVAFTALFYSGAVHGSDPKARRYEMPTYGKSNYINPYELLEEDRQFQDAQALPQP